MINFEDVHNKGDKVQKLQERMDEIPFGNSEYQNLLEVIGRSITPGRAYRSALRRIDNRLQALEHCKFQLRREDIEIKKLKLRIDLALPDSEVVPDFETELAEIDLEEKLANQVRTQKLIKDALIELNTLNQFVECFPVMTRSQFEDQESLHFKERLTRLANGISDPALGIISLAEDYPRLMEYVGQLDPGKELPEFKLEKRTPEFPPGAPRKILDQVNNRRFLE